METKTEVKIIEVDYVCPKCKTGNLRPTRRVLTTHPVKYPHQCNICDHNEVFYVNYPYKIYKKTQ